MIGRSPEPVVIAVDAERRVSGLLQRPAGVRICLVLAHGAGAGMTHPFMEAVAEGLAERGIATLRYQFWYMEQHSKRPDSPKVAEATVRAAVAEATRRVPELALLAGGKSFGGRMTSQAQAASPLPGVRGLVFLGFPLHAAGRGSNQTRGLGDADMRGEEREKRTPAGSRLNKRGEHLFDVHVPMLFLQGARDKLAEIGLMQELVGRLGARATLKTLADADHSFHVPARTGRTDAQVLAEMLDAVAEWSKPVLRS